MRSSILLVRQLRLKIKVGQKTQIVDGGLKVGVSLDVSRSRRSFPFTLLSKFDKRVRSILVVGLPKIIFTGVHYYYCYHFPPVWQCNWMKVCVFVCVTKKSSVKRHGRGEGCSRVLLVLPFLPVTTVPKVLTLSRSLYFKSQEFGSFRNLLTSLNC